MLSCYIAMSLDGYIASIGGSVDWLNPYNEMLAQRQDSYIGKAYENYFKTIDSLVMGSATFDSLQSFDMDYPYQDKENYVITRTPEKYAFPYAKAMTLEQFIDVVPEGKTWVVGGGKIVSELIDLDMLDELIITVMPTVLGQGIPLFHTQIQRNFECVKSVCEFGIVELTYVKKDV